MWWIFRENGQQVRAVKGSFIKYVRRIFRKTISNPLTRTCAYAYQGVRNVSFSENSGYVLNGWPLCLYKKLLDIQQGSKYASTLVSLA